VHFLVDNAEPNAKLYDFVIRFDWFDLIFTLNKKEQCCHSVQKTMSIVSIFTLFKGVGFNIHVGQ
jgi:hypothetical protein